MNLLLRRNEFTELSSVGILSINSISECYTLEDKDRGLNSGMTLDEIKSIKVSSTTCIPYGQYKVIKYLSHKQGKLVPLLVDVPGFDYVEIHVGNKPEDTDGCILVGAVHPAVPDWIGSSKIAFERLMSKLERAWGNAEDVSILITKENTNVVA